MRYSGWRIFKEALTGHKGWTAAWRDPAPQAAYDYIIVGGGGHGLATAYYLAKEFKQARIAVLEKGYLGGGNVGPQHHDHPVELSAGRQRAVLRIFSLKLWEGLEQDFNYNAMVSASAAS